jgi:mycothiol synthase
VRVFVEPPSEFAKVRDRVVALDSLVRDTRGIAPLNESVWRDIDHPSPDSALIFAAGDTGVAHVARSDTFTPQHWVIGVAATFGRIPVLKAALDHIASHGGGHVVYWVLGADDADDRELAPLGFVPTRDLYEMRVPLPLSEAAKLPDGFTVRTFEPGRDEQAWLVVNNRAFKNHPEQGGWIEATLARREADPWFDPSLFLLAFRADELAGFNWCKVHSPQLGEIFVIGVDPSAQGTGLGRALAIEGLHRMAARGITTGSLFTAADNAPAVKLYKSLGFTVHRTDRAYDRDVEPVRADAAKPGMA